MKVGGIVGVLLAGQQANYVWGFQSISHGLARQKSLQYNCVKMHNTWAIIQLQYQQLQDSRSQLVVLHQSNNKLEDDDNKNNNVPERIEEKSSWMVPISDNPTRALWFSLLMSLCGAALGPFLDSYHSNFGVLQYDEPITATLWGSTAQPALVTTWWVPFLFGLAGLLIGWLYILLDHIFLLQRSSSSTSSPETNQPPQAYSSPSWPKIFASISVFTLQYWLSGILYASQVDRTTILNVMSIIAAAGFYVFDGSLAGWITSAATAIGGPLIEVGLLSASLSGILPGGYHYTDLGETGFFPIWIVPVYFMGGPAVGNLARGFWKALPSSLSSSSSIRDSKGGQQTPCTICNDTRRNICPNCEGMGTYTAMGGRSVTCTSCRGRGFVICRYCFDRYDEDPNDIDAIRDLMSRMPD